MYYIIEKYISPTEGEPVKGRNTFRTGYEKEWLDYLNSQSIKIFNSLYSANKYAKKHGYEIPEYCTLVYTNQELYNRLEKESKSNDQAFTEAWNETEELHCSLRELNDEDLLNCRKALIERAKKIMRLLED